MTDVWPSLWAQYEKAPPSYRPYEPEVFRLYEPDRPWDEVVAGDVEAAKAAVERLRTDAECLRVLALHIGNAYRYPENARLQQLSKGSGDYRRKVCGKEDAFTLLRACGFVETDTAWSATQPCWSVLKVLTNATAPVLSRAIVVAQSDKPRIGALQRSQVRVHLCLDRPIPSRWPPVELPLRRAGAYLECSSLSSAGRAAVRLWSMGQLTGAELLGWVDADIPTELRPPVSWVSAVAGARCDPLAPYAAAVLTEVQRGPRAMLLTAAQRVSVENGGRTDLTEEEVNLTFRRLLVKARTESPAAAAHICVQLWQELTFLQHEREDDPPSTEVAVGVLDDKGLNRTLGVAPEQVEAQVTEVDAERFGEENRCIHRYLCSLARTHKALQKYAKAGEISGACDVLGVDAAADAQAVKRAYRDMCLKHHPDKGGDPEAFQACKVAYSQLLGELRENAAPERTKTTLDALGCLAARAPVLAEEALILTQLAAQALRKHDGSYAILSIATPLCSKVHALGSMVVESGELVTALMKVNPTRLLQEIAGRCSLFGQETVGAAELLQKTLARLKRSGAAPARSVLLGVECCLRRAGEAASQAATAIHEAHFHATEAGGKPVVVEEAEAEAEAAGESPESEPEKPPPAAVPESEPVSENVAKRLKHCALFQQLNKDTRDLQGRVKKGIAGLPVVTAEEKQCAFTVAGVMMGAACARIMRAQDPWAAFIKAFASDQDLAVPGLWTPGSALRVTAALDAEATQRLLDEVVSKLPRGITEAARDLVYEQVAAVTA